MPHFPMFIDLKDQTVLVAGGGSVALRKVRKLLPYGPEFRVVAPEISEEISQLPEVTALCRPFRMGDLRPRPAMVIAATDDPELNRKIAQYCKKHYIPVNVADCPEECSFLFPALVQQGEFSAGITTGGASPTAAVYFKEQLQSLLPENLDQILSWLEQQRPELKASVPEQCTRAGISRRMFDACMAKRRPLTAKEKKACMDNQAVGSVALVGASCGKADLITVRGLRLLQQCQAVVYDDLIDPALLEAAPETAQRIYMGKRSGEHSAPQKQINQKLIELAQSGLRVVRLKGGDPYLFGRGGEEMLALKEAGISCQEVPGIPSAIGIPAEVGIPVTHRGASRGLHIITAHTSDTPDGLPEDFDHLAKLSGTLVFLMGLAQLPKISQRLIAAGKSPDTPASVISGGNSQNPALVRAPLWEISEKAKDVASPAIIMVGQVAALDLSQKPLSGIWVGITGTAHVAKKQISALEALGAETSWVTQTEVKKYPLENVLPQLEGKTGWLVFTSANGVRVFFEELGNDPAKLAVLEGKKYAVIGVATKNMLAQYGLEADLCPQTFTSEALARELAQTAQKEEAIFLLRSAIGSPILPEILTQAGLTVSDIPVYNISGEGAGEVLPQMDYLTFSSASGVEAFIRQYGSLPKNVKYVCIGHITAKKLEEYTADPYLTAQEITVPGIVQTIVDDVL